MFGRRKVENSEFCPECNRLKHREDFGMNLISGTYRRELEGGWIELREGWIKDQQSWMENMLGELDLTQDRINMMGKRIPLPRLTAWVGEGAYEYSGIENNPDSWGTRATVLRIEVLRTLNIDLELGVDVNSMLANLYRDGSDSVSWHSDDEPELGDAPLIASVSLGATRRFKLRNKTTNEKIDLDLTGGSLLLMGGDIQQHWEHCVPKTKKHVEPRLNLTFRNVKVDA